MMKTVAIIPAAGAGVRMKMDHAKQYMDLNGRPLLSVTLEKFQTCKTIDRIVLVVPPHDIDYCQKEIITPYHLSKVQKIVGGGERRQDSVRLGLEATKGLYEWVVIHDGVRPLIEPQRIEEVVKAGQTERAVITALPSRDTVKEVGQDGFVVRTYERQCVYLVQTPQAFRYDDIMAAHQKAYSEQWEEMTDDAFLMEKMGIPVKIVLGSEKNIKVTTPHDLELVRFLMDQKK